MRNKKKAANIIQTALREYLQSIVKFLIKQAGHYLLGLKIQRQRTGYKENVTAAIAIPRKSWPHKAWVENPIVTNLPEKPSTNSIVSTFLNLFSKKVEPLQTKAPELLPTKSHPAKPRFKVRSKIEMLEKKYKAEKDEKRKDQILCEKIKVVKDQIVEHAARRMDLLFYSLVAVHGKRQEVTAGKTIKQHGIGSMNKRASAGCHAALFSHLEFKPTFSPLSWLICILSKTSLDGTHFAESLNLTDELPYPANHFDKHLEGMYARSVYFKDSLKILNKVSQADLSPEQGMNELLKIQHTFYTYVEESYVKTGKVKHPEAFSLIWKYQQKGTFLAAKKGALTVDDNYIYLMLRLKPDEIALVKQKPNKLAAYYERIQDEIFVSKPVQPLAKKMRGSA